MKAKRQLYLVAMLVIASMVLASCGGGDNTPTVIAPSVSGIDPPPAAPTQAAQPTSAPSNSSSGAAMKNPDTLVEGETGEPQSLDPAWLYDATSGEIAQQVYEPLLMYKRDATDQYAPVLATRWDISSDGKTYTFTIRKGVKFQEGQDLTPEDVAYSFWRGMIQDRAGGPQWIVLQPLLGLDVGSFQGDVVDKQFNKDFKAACEAVRKSVTFDNNADTVTFHLKQSFGPMLQILTGSWGYIVSKSWVAGQGGWDGDCATAQKYHDPKAEEDELFQAMNGTGPYKLQRWMHGEEIALTRNDNYWLTQPLWDGGPSGPAKVKNVLVKYISEWGTRFAALQSGDIDFAIVDPQYISQADPLVKETCGPSGGCTATNANGTLRLYKNLPSVAADGIFFTQNVNTVGGSSRLGSGKLDGNGIPPDFFSDIHVRKAFNYCFDWDTFINQVYHSEAMQVFGPIISGEIGYDPNQAHYSLNLDKCASEFKASTLKSESGQSLWDTGFSLQYVYDTGTDNRKTAGEILKDNLQTVNPKFKFEVTSEPWAAMLTEIQSGQLPLFMVGWIEDYHDTHDWVTPYLTSTGSFSGGQHFEKSLQDQLDNLVTQGIQNPDQKERTTIYKQLQNMAYENALDIFLEQPQFRRYEQTWVHGWYYNPTYPGNSYYPGTYFYALSKGQ